MAKQQSPMPMPMPGGGGKLPKVIGTLAILGVLMLVLKQPVQAAQIVKGVFGALEGAVEGFSTFFMQLGQAAK